MSLYPAAELKLLPENETQAQITPRCVILHSAGSWGELYGWWMNSQSKGLESHAWIGRYGRFVQYIDTHIKADANGEANRWFEGGKAFGAISVETASSQQANEPWEPEAVDEIVAFLDWCCREHVIPRRIMRHKTDGGIGWHVMFGAPGPWTKARGKVCPGPARIRQIHDEIMPRLIALGENGAAPPTERKGLFMDLTPNEEREILTKVRTIDAAMPRKDFVMRDRRDGRVWVFSDGGRYWIRNMDALSLMIFAGKIQGFGPEGVPNAPPGQVGYNMIDGVPEITTPTDIWEYQVSLDPSIATT